MKSIDLDTVKLFNLMDESEYIVTSNKGTEVLGKFLPGHFVITRLVPLDEFYLFSGGQAVFPPEAKEQIKEVALKMAKSNMSKMLGHNKEKWFAAWKMQEKYKNSFLSLFGSDVLIVPGNKLAETINRLIDYHNEKALIEMPEDKRDIYKNVNPELNVPDVLATEDSVGIIFDDVEGLNFYSNFKVFMETFEDPSLLSDEEHKDIVMGYLWSDTISTLPFKIMIERYPENAARVFSDIFNKVDWDNEKDFKLFMKKYKGSFLKRKPVPSVIPGSKK